MSSEHSRIPPHSVEAEESILGGILLDNTAIDLVLERINSDDFYKASHQAIFKAVTKIAERREPIDIITLSAELKTMNELDRAGGLDYLGKLSTIVPSSANVGYYAGLVKNFSLRRSMINEASAIITGAFNDQKNIKEFLDESEQKILGVSDERINKAFTPVGEVVTESITLIGKLAENKQLVTGVSTGYEQLDKMTAGFQKSDLIIIAARPSMGKTALALNMAQWVGIHENKAVAVFSLEMSKEQLVLRMLCSEARVNNQSVRTGFLKDRDFPKLLDAGSKISEAPVYIDDTPAITVTELRAKSRRLHRENPLSLIVVDYLQLMKSPAYQKSREQEISDISRSLKALAKELSVPVVALSQLNRSVESRNDKRPLMSDLRESGAIEQDADLIMFIYRDEVYNEETADKGIAEILLAKHRSGPTGVVRLAFSANHTRFDNLAERFDNDGFSAVSGVTEDIDVSVIDSGDLF